jgi:hypothetical protein
MFFHQHIVAADMAVDLTALHIHASMRIRPRRVARRPMAIAASVM